MKKYTRLKEEERNQIFVLLNKSKSIAKIAKMVGRHKQTTALKAQLPKNCYKNKKSAYINPDDTAKGLNPANISKVKISAGKQRKELRKDLFCHRNDIIRADTFKKARESGYIIVLIYAFVDI